jgi:hypothetical protein
MGLQLRGVSKSSNVVAMSAASLLRAGITTLLRRADLAPAVLIVAFISLLAHVLVGDDYGYFRDELYVLAMSQHPAFGYVDVPPLVPWITLLPRLLTGSVFLLDEGLLPNLCITREVSVFRCLIGSRAVYFHHCMPIPQVWSALPRHFPSTYSYLGASAQVCGPKLLTCRVIYHQGQIPSPPLAVSAGSVPYMKQESYVSTQHEI